MDEIDFAKAVVPRIISFSPIVFVDEFSLTVRKRKTCFKANIFFQMGLLRSW